MRKDYLRNYLSVPAAGVEWECDFELRKIRTNIGHLLRRTGVDELPLLWNVRMGIPAWPALNRLCWQGQHATAIKWNISLAPRLASQNWLL
jgi:hypothetical protein